MLKRECAIELLEFSSAVGEGRQSLAQDPSGEPAFCGRETLESLNGFEPAVELFVHALNQVCGSWTIDVEDGFGFDIGGELLAALEDVIEGGDLHGIIVMPGGSPPDASL